MSFDIGGTGIVKPVVARHIRQRRQQPVGLCRQPSRVRGSLVAYDPTELRIAEERINIARLDSVEAQTQQQVLADQRVGLHAG